MEIKGTAVKSIVDFVKTKFPDRFIEWLNALPQESKKIMSGGIYAVTWYPLNEAAIIPTQTIGKLFFNDVKKGAWECGRFSAEIALTGIYKLYVKLSSPGHIIERAGRIFAAYYQPSEMQAVNNKKNSVEVHITKFPEPNPVIEYRIAGWIEKALEISGCHEVQVNIQESLTKGDKITRFLISWK